MGNLLTTSSIFSPVVPECSTKTSNEVQELAKKEYGNSKSDEVSVVLTSSDLLIPCSRLASSVN